MACFGSPTGTKYELKHFEISVISDAIILLP